MQGISRTKHQGGFSLIELAVVLIILSVLLGLGLSAMNAQLTRAHFETTTKRQQIVKDALVNYLRVNRRLPCPANAVSDGVQVPDNMVGPCNPGVVAGTTNFGILPWRTLGLDRDTAIDGWGTLFSYMVSNSNAAGQSQNWTSNVTVFGDNLGALMMQDRTAIPPVRRFSAAIISHGQNTLGGFTAKGTANIAPPPATNPEEVFNNGGTPDTFFLDEPTPTFDDVVVGISADELNGLLIRDGGLPEPRRATSQRIDELFDRLLGDIVNGRVHQTDNSSPGCSPPDPPCYYSEYPVPPGGPPPPPPALCDAVTGNDRWGRPLRCDTTSQGTTIDQGSVGPTTSVIKIWSGGPDRTDTNANDGNLCVDPPADDVCRSMSVEQFVGLITGQSGFR